MSATTIISSDPLMIPVAPEMQQSAAAAAVIIGQIEVVELESAKCECCGLTEECTPAYIARVREGYYGKWVCGLCAEAVKDETVHRLITIEEAVAQHTIFCNKFSSAAKPPADPTLLLIAAMRQILRKSLDTTPRGIRSTPSSPKTKAKICRSGSCFSSLSS